MSLFWPLMASSSRRSIATCQPAGRFVPRCLFRQALGSASPESAWSFKPMPSIRPNRKFRFNILLRSFDDISVIASPSLLSIRNLVLLVGLLLVLLFAAGARGWLIERKVRRQNAAMAYIERRRSRILEDINGSRPLAEIIQQITELVSFKLSGAPCWCQIVDGAQLGNCPSNLTPFRIVQEPIPARNGPPLGTMYAAFDPLTKQHTGESETLSTAAALASRIGR